jgi:hypothetical protein
LWALRKVETLIDYRQTIDLGPYTLNPRSMSLRTNDEFPLKIFRSVLSQRYDERQGGLTSVWEKPATSTVLTPSNLVGLWRRVDFSWSIERNVGRPVFSALLVGGK